MAAFACAMVATPVRAEPAPPLVFGLDSATSPYSPPSASEFQTMQVTGVGTYRVMFFWPLIEPSEHQFDWTSTDADVTNAAMSGVETVPFFLGSPQWLNGCSNVVAKCQHEPPVKTQAERDAWVELLTNIVGRYGPNGSFWQEHPELPQLSIHSWQIWNEPNLPGFVGGNRNDLASAPARYAELLAASAPAIRAVDPAAQIVFAGLTPGSAHGRGNIARFLDSVYAIPDVKEDFDVVAVHPYSPNMDGIKRVMDRTIRTVRRNHDNARLWVTEVGWSSSPGRNSASGQRGLRRGPAGQRKLVKQAFRLFTSNRNRWRLDRVYYFAWADIPNGDPKGWAATAGLRRLDLSPKPAWKAFDHMMDRYALP